MLRVGRTIGFFLAIAAAQAAIAQQSSTSKWRPGQYRGLVTGKSTAQDVVHVLGNPDWRGKPIEVPDEPGAEEWSYGIKTPQGECCDLYFQNSVLQSIDLKFTGLILSEAEKEFGGGFEPIRFRTEEDKPPTGSGQLCEDPNGDFTLFVNPQKGISLWINSAGLVGNAVFSATRSGSQNCKKPQHKPTTQQ